MTEKANYKREREIVGVGTQGTASASASASTYACVVSMQFELRNGIWCAMPITYQIQLMAVLPQRKLSTCSN